MYFISSNYSEFSKEVILFASQLTNALAILLGFSPAEQASAVADGAYMQWVVNGDAAAEGYAHEWKNFMHQVRHGDAANPLLTVPVAPTSPVFAPAPPLVNLDIQGRLMINANKAKNSANYTEAIGQKLGIVSTKTPIDPAKAKPKVDVHLNGGFPEIHFIKGPFPAGNLYKDSGSGFGTTPFKTLVNSHYVDTTPLPAANVAMLLRYKVIYLDHNAEVGLESDVASITVVGK